MHACRAATKKLDSAAQASESADESGGKKPRREENVTVVHKSVDAQIAIGLHQRSPTATLMSGTVVSVA
jgi:hypothetical protein